MEFINPKINIDFVSKRYWAFAISGLLLLISLFSLATRGLNFGLDFSGGAVMQVRFPGPAPVHDIRVALGEIGLGAAVIQEFGAPEEILIRIHQAHQEGQDGQTASKMAQKIVDTLNPLSGASGKVELRRVEFVGPQVGHELTVNGIWAVVYSWLAILVYVGVRFEFRFAFGAVLSLIHDVFLILGFFAFTQKEFSLVVVAAVLTVIGYSINDTIVVFDRIRDETKRLRNQPLEVIINEATNRTLGRTINVSLTVVLVLLALYFYGGEVIHDFSVALLLGVVIGTWSSIYVASPTVLLFEHWKLARQAKVGS
ncbi:Protein translocase subunit SecF [Candidatus Magnetaquicoccaceae bacterium FCR-1]|uniref:Protein-export membrane protein SecF n=1 Tax=Candidatus Magnetaquiglobus chichijimensis TaxID=3141448 RepID=A0ABQ0C6J8_9PROT